MSQAQIIEILKKNGPKYISFKEIFDSMDCSRRTTYRTLKRLLKCEEVEYIVKRVVTNNIPAWKTFYRIRRD